MIDIDNRIVAGHQRVKILAELGRLEEEIEVRVPNRKLTEDEYREYLIRSNKNVGEWDWEMLRNEYDYNELLEAGFDKWEIELDETMEEGEREGDNESYLVMSKERGLFNIYTVWGSVPLNKLKILCDRIQTKIDAGENRDEIMEKILDLLLDNIK